MEPEHVNYEDIGGGTHKSARRRNLSYDTFGLDDLQSKKKIPSTVISS